MIKVRSLHAALLYIRSLDADTSISGNAIRMLVETGKVPAIKIGNKHLVNVELIIKYFEDQLSGTEPDDHFIQPCDDIRPVPERKGYRR